MATEVFTVYVGVYPDAAVIERTEHGKVKIAAGAAIGAAAGHADGGARDHRRS